MTASPLPRQPERPSDTRLAALLEQHRLQVCRTLDGNEDFLTMLCAHADGRQQVLKYCRSNAPDALRRLRNEALLTRHLAVRPPLRVLRHCADGPGYLITDFEAGEALGPQHLGDAELMPKIADALAVFQSLGACVQSLGVTRRETTRRFLLKVMAKHLLHLWPSHLGLAQGVRAWRLLWAGLTDIDAVSVPCHADLLPTNMLRDADSTDVLFIDLEGFIVAHHPLYDVLSFFTIDARPVSAWDWQVSFLQRYLRQPPAADSLTPSAPAFARAYRALLTFLLVYRYNEACLNAVGGRYFNGGSKRAYVLAKLLRLFSGIGLLTPRAQLNDELATRRDNLRHALDSKAFAEHLSRMLATPDTARAQPA